MNETTRIACRKSINLQIHSIQRQLIPYALHAFSFVRSFVTFFICASVDWIPSILFHQLSCKLNFSVCRGNETKAHGSHALDFHSIVTSNNIDVARGYACFRKFQYKSEHMIPITGFVRLINFFFRAETIKSPRLTDSLTSSLPMMPISHSISLLYSCKTGLTIRNEEGSMRIVRAK